MGETQVHATGELILNIIIETFFNLPCNCCMSIITAVFISILIYIIIYLFRVVKDYKKLNRYNGKYKVWERGKDKRNRNKLVDSNIKYIYLRTIYKNVLSIEGKSTSHGKEDKFKGHIYVNREDNYKTGNGYTDYSNTEVEENKNVFSIYRHVILPDKEDDIIKIFTFNTFGFKEEGDKEKRGRKTTENFLVLIKENQPNQNIFKFIFETLKYDLL